MRLFRWNKRLWRTEVKTGYGRMTHSLLLHHFCCQLERRKRRGGLPKGRTTVVGRRVEEAGGGVDTEWQRLLRGVALTNATHPSMRALVLPFVSCIKLAGKYIRTRIYRLQKNCAHRQDVDAAVQAPPAEEMKNTESAASRTQ